MSLFFVVVIFQLEKGRCVQESSPSHAYLFQTSSQNNIVPVACDLIGSGYFKFKFQFKSVIARQLFELKMQIMSSGGM